MTSFQGANIQENFVNEKSFVGFFRAYNIAFGTSGGKKSDRWLVLDVRPIGHFLY
jgi:hypothetical protein